MWIQHTTALNRVIRCIVLKYILQWIQGYDAIEPSNKIIHSNSIKLTRFRPYNTNRIWSYQCLRKRKFSVADTPTDIFYLKTNNLVCLCLFNVHCNHLNSSNYHQSDVIILRAEFSFLHYKRPVSRLTQWGWLYIAQCSEITFGKKNLKIVFTVLTIYEIIFSDHFDLKIKFEIV